MGRFYCGDIEGKFWFGVQNSDDICNLVNIEPNICYSWKVCHCVAELDDDDDDDNVFCKYCYETKEAHIEAAREEEEYEDECLYYDENSCGYSLDKSTHYQELQETMKNLKKEIPEEILKEFEKIEQNDDILNAFTGVFNHTFPSPNQMEDRNEKQNLAELVARYTLGYQIEYCLRTTDSCNVNCES